MTDMNKPPSDETIEIIARGIGYKRTAEHLRDQWKAANEKIVERLEAIYDLRPNEMPTNNCRTAFEQLDQLIREMKP